MQFTGAFLTLSVLLIGVVADSGFGLSCTNIHLSGSGSGLAIDATCTNEGGGNNGNQVLSLSTCLSNNNGELGCQLNGEAMQSCTNCGLAGTSLTCTCTRNNGGTDTTSIDLNNCIGNRDGRMFCS